MMNFIKRLEVAMKLMDLDNGSLKHLPEFMWYSLCNEDLDFKIKIHIEYHFQELSTEYFRKHQVTDIWDAMDIAKEVGSQLIQKMRTNLYDRPIQWNASELSKMDIIVSPMNYVDTIFTWMVSTYVAEKLYWITRTYKNMDKSILISMIRKCLEHLAPYACKKPEEAGYRFWMDEIQFSFDDLDVFAPVCRGVQVVSERNNKKEIEQKLDQMELMIKEIRSML